jgi:hypothetical protein
MSRRRRIIVPGLPHHIPQRGDDRSAVYQDNEDRELHLFRRVGAAIGPQAEAVEGRASKKTEAGNKSRRNQACAATLDSHPITRLPIQASKWDGHPLIYHRFLLSEDTRSLSPPIGRKRTCHHQRAAALPGIINR